MKKLVLLLLILFSNPVFSAEISDHTHLFVAATNVRIRETPSTKAKVTATLKLGTWCKILEKSTQKQNLIGKDDYWYRISTNTDQGWIFGGLTSKGSEKDFFTGAMALINERIVMNDKPVSDYVQLYEFAQQIAEASSDGHEKALAQAAVLRVLDALCNKMSIEGRGSDITLPPMQENKQNIYYHESAGQYFVNPESFWELAKKYCQYTQVADDIAWLAANQQLPGETEGDPEMMMGFFDLSYARYMRLFPEGKNVNRALEIGKDTFTYILENISSDYFAGNSEFKSSFKKRLDEMEDLANKTADTEARGSFTNVLGQIKAKID